MMSSEVRLWTPTCDRCKKKMTEPGAVIFSPPVLNPEQMVFKLHLCSSCWNKFFKLLPRRKR